MKQAKRGLGAWVLSLIGASAFLAGVLAVPAGAQDEADKGAKTADLVVVEQIDSRTDRWLLEGRSRPGEPAITASDKALEAQVTTDIATDIAIVIDNDRSLGNGTVQLEKAAALLLLPGTGNINSVAVVTSATAGARQQVSLTSSAESVSAAIDSIQQDGDSALMDGLHRAANLLSSSSAPSKRVVVFASATDKLSDATSASVLNSLRQAGARVDVVVLPQGADTAALGSLVSNLGGSQQSIGSDEEFSAASEAVLGGIASQFRAEFNEVDAEATTQLVVTNGNASQQVVVHPGGLQTGSEEVLYTGADQGTLDSLMNNPLIRWVAILLLLAAVVGFVWSLLSLVVPDGDSLARRLKDYEDAPINEIDDDEENAGVTTVPIIQRAVALTGEVAEKRGLLETVETTLERANLPLRAAEAMFFVGVVSVLFGVLCWALSGSLLVGLGAGVLALLLPKMILGIKVSRRQKKFVALLPDMLILLAGTLKAGYSITQGFEAVAKEVPEPMARELGRVVTENRLGRPLEDALEATGDRMDSDDFRWSVMAIRIQREVGGNLSELLMTVANTMIQRERLRRDVQSLTAEGRMSAMILGLLPPGLAMVMYVMNKEYIMQLFTPGLGYVMIGAALISMVIGFIWMKKIITIEV